MVGVPRARVADLETQIEAYVGAQKWVRMSALMAKDREQMARLCAQADRMRERLYPVRETLRRLLAVMPLKALDPATVWLRELLADVDAALLGHV